MTRAGRLHAILMLSEMRAEAFKGLGVRPAWWRPFARRRWYAERSNVLAWAAKVDEWIAAAWSDQESDYLHSLKQGLGL